LRALGHRRFDVPQDHLLFHNVFQYAIAFYREPRVVIVRVVHSKRDFERLF
jgi:plasmid stabilization system protein ParE